MWQGGWRLAARAWMLAKLMEGDRYDWFPDGKS